LETKASGGYVALIRDNRNFRNLWSGQVVSLFGDWFNLIASASLVASLTGSGIAVGGLFVARMLAPFLISPFAGVAADRYNRKHLLIATDVVRAVVVLGFLFIRTPSQLWLVYALTFVQLAMHGVFFPTRNSILPDIVSPSELGAANAITGATWSVMLAFGAAAGGLVAGGWGIRPAFVIDSATFLLSIIFIARIRYQPPRVADNQDKSVTSAFDDYFEGLRYLARHRGIFVITLQKAALALSVVGAYEVLQVAIARDVFVIGDGGGISLGILYATVGVGSGLGPILARSITGDRERSLRVAISVSYVLMAIGLAVVSTLHSFGAVLFGTLIRSMGGGTLWVFSTQLLLQLVPERIRGRIFATEYAMLTLSMAASAGFAGWSLDHWTLGISGMLTWMSGAVLIPGALWTLWNFLHIDERNDP
jgi:MFS family permease